MKKIYINSKKKRLMERNSYTLRLSIQDTKGKKTAVSVLVKKLVPNDVGTFHTRIPTVAVVLCQDLVQVKMRKFSPF